MFYVPAETLQSEYVVKKSRFIAFASRVTSKDQAKKFLGQQKQAYPDARHHCWAYLIGNPSSHCSAAMNDDGEPSGTAGKPILNVIRHKNIGDVIVVVVRYFGGIKLGAGGLTRAYSNSTEQVLSQLKLVEQVPICEMMVQCRFEQEQLVRHWIKSNAARIKMCQYENDVMINVILPINVKSKFIDFSDAHHIHLSEKTVPGDTRK